MNSLQLTQLHHAVNLIGYPESPKVTSYRDQTPVPNQPKLNPNQTVPIYARETHSWGFQKGATSCSLLQKHGTSPIQHPFTAHLANHPNPAPKTPPNQHQNPETSNTLYNRVREKKKKRKIEKMPLAFFIFFIFIYLFFWVLSLCSLGMLWVWNVDSSLSQNWDIFSNCKSQIMIFYKQDLFYLWYRKSQCPIDIN